MLKDVEESYVKVQNEQLKPDTATDQEIIVLQNRIVELSNTITDLQQENKMLLSIQTAKTEAIVKLTDELNARGATEEYIAELKKTIQKKEQELQQSAEDNKQLMRLLQDKEETIKELKG